jgi:hypothetical protein
MAAGGASYSSTYFWHIDNYRRPISIRPFFIFYRSDNTTKQAQHDRFAESFCQWLILKGNNTLHLLLILLSSGAP